MIQEFYRKLSAITLSNMGFDGAMVEQGSPEWLRMRLGVMTASRASDLIGKGRGKDARPGSGESRKTYINELVAEVTTGAAAEQGKFKATEWGHEHEATAREIFGFHVGTPIQQIPFIFLNDECRAGCSPDGLAIDGNMGAEIKNPFNSANFVDFFLNANAEELVGIDYFENPDCFKWLDKGYYAQVQFSMFVTGLNYWSLSYHDPRQKCVSFHSVMIEKSLPMMRTFADCVSQTAHDIDKALEKFGIKFGDHWKN